LQVIQHPLTVCELSLVEAPNVDSLLKTKR
jgi:hypothetical protein